MATQIQIRRDDTAGWAAADPILAQGELGLDTDLNTFKIGNGTATWTELSFYAGSGDTFVPLPDFLTYAQGREHLAVLNTNFGWDSSGAWFGPTAMGGTSYPVFTDFTINQNDAVTVEFNVEIDQECNDVGLCVYLDGDTPQWQWGIDTTRIAAQFDCLMPMLVGITEEYQGERSNIPTPGMYHVRFTYNPIGGTPVQFEYFQGTTTETLINSMTLNETLGAGSYRVGFAADNGGGKTYISDLSITVNEDTPYTDTLQNGSSGGSVDIADFVFEYDGDQSTMTIHNHDMRIQTTRDDTQDADIDINSADDIWITSNDTLELTSVTDEIRLRTGENAANQWLFTSIGTIELPTLNSSINSGVDGTVITDSRTATFSNNYQDASIGIQTNTSIVLAVTADTSWFASYTVDTSNPATITFADSTTVQTTNVYDGTSQGTAGVIFQWVGDLTKTFEETYPLTITGNVYQPNNYVGITANGADWQFASDGEIRFPSTQPSNNRTGTGEVLQFGNPTQQSIITGSKPTVDNPTAQRLVIAGQDGIEGTSFDGEGGDIYLWGGQGGGFTGSGGDIKVDAGNGTLDGGGGTIKVRGGYSVNSNGGFVDIYAGDSSMGSGGNVNIAAGTNQSVSEAIGGSVYIYGGGSADANGGGSVGLYTYQNGKIILSGEGGEFLNDASNPNNQIATLSSLPFILVATPVTSIGQDGDVPGRGAIDANYIYYCVDAYNGTNNIWKRVAWSSDTW